MESEKLNAFYKDLKGEELRVYEQILANNIAKVILLVKAFPTEYLKKTLQEHKDMTFYTEKTLDSAHLEGRNHREERFKALIAFTKKLNSTNPGLIPEENRSAFEADLIGPKESAKEQIAKVISGGVYDFDV